MSIRLVVADDHPIVLLGLVQLLSAEPDFDVVAEVGNGVEALEAVRRLQPDVLVLDLCMPGMDGLAVLSALRREAVSTHVVILSALGGDDLSDAIRLGARGVVLKDMASRLLVQCVRTVHAGAKWLEKSRAMLTVETMLARNAGDRAAAKTLTPRELQVARLIAQGLHTKAVAEHLVISYDTAKQHLHNVYAKLDLEGRVGLMRYMHRKGLDRL